MKVLALLGAYALLTLGCVGQIPSSPATSSPSTPVARSSEPAPVQIASASPMLVRSGMFVDGEHPTQGTVRLITEDGKSYLEFGQDFKTDAGPALVVALHRAADVIGSTTPPAYPLQASDYVVLAPLQSTEGTQRYAIPADLNLADYQSAVVWCQQFNATFGAASLSL